MLFYGTAIIAFDCGNTHSVFQSLCDPPTRHTMITGALIGSLMCPCVHVHACLRVHLCRCVSVSVSVEVLSQYACAFMCVGRCG